MNDPEELALQLVENNQKQLEIQQKIMDATVQFQRELQTYQKQDAELRAAIEGAMDEAGTKSYEDDNIKIVRVAASQRTGLDTNKVKLLHPEVFEQCMKVTPVKASIRITLKDKS